MNPTTKDLKASIEGVAVNPGTFQIVYGSNVITCKRIDAALSSWLEGSFGPANDDCFHEGPTRVDLVARGTMRQLIDSQTL